MGHPQTLIHLDRQRQCLGPQLHRRRSQGSGGLPRIAPWHPFMAHRATTDGNIEAPPERPAHDFLLVLRLDPLHFQGAPAATPCRRRHYDDFVHLRRSEFAEPLAITGTRLAPRGLGILFPRAPRKRCRWSLARALCFFQLSLQLFVFFAQLFPFLFQLLLSPPQLLHFFPQPFNFSASSTPPCVSTRAGQQSDRRPWTLLWQLTVTKCEEFVQP